MPGLKSSRWALRDPRDARSSSVPASSTRSQTAESNRKVTSPKVASQLDTSQEKTQKDKQRDKGASPPTQDPQAGARSATAELSRYSKIVRRMKWKLPFLDLAYQRATADHGIDAASKVEAELMFKLDFFDYYMLCERALVHLQGVFGITIRRGHNSLALGIPGPQTKTVEKNSNNKYPHRYHANVLGALEMEDNPLHEALGKGDVRAHLARAKDLRNHWKNADDDDPKTTTTTGAQNKNKARAAPLSSYDLAEILTSIHQGLDKAFAIASKHAADCVEGQTGADALETNAMTMEVEMEDDDEWGFMVDAMDWEAV